MANLKRVLAGALSLCMVGSMLTACGSSSSTSDSSKSSSSKAGDSSASSSGDSSTESKADRKVTTDVHGKPSSDASKKTLRIYCWNTEFKERLDKYYPQGTKLELKQEDYEKKNDDGSTTKLSQITEINGVKVEWVQNPNEGNVYQTKLDEDLSKQADSDNKIDMFLIEADYALKYINSDYVLSVQDLGITEDDLKEQYKYTKDVATNTNDNELKGVSWQATPGLFLYNTVYAKDVLGTDEPDKVQEFVKDWDAFKDTAKKMKDKGIKMMAGPDDAYRLFSNSMTAPWVTDDKITIDPQLKKWAEQTKEYADAGYLDASCGLWSKAWAAGQKVDGKTFGYFFSTWGIPFTLAPNTGDAGNGKWAACYGPQSYFWGGTWICGATDADNTDIIGDIMKVMTCNKDVMKKITEGEQDYTNNKAGIKELIDGGYKSSFLAGGQNHLALLTENADKIDLTNKLSAYDQGCNEKFQAAMADWFKGNTKSYDDAVAKFKTEITKLYSNLKMD